MQLISQVFSSVFGNPPTKSFPLCDLSASQIRDHIGLNLCNYGVMTKAEIEGTSPLTHEFPLPRYGAHFVLLEFTSLPAGYDGFDVKLNTPGTEAILFDISGNSYEDLSAWRSWEEGLEDNWIEGHTYLLMVINVSDTHYGGGLTGSTASLTVTCTDMNEGYDGRFPQKSIQMPERYEGTLTRRIMNKIGVAYSYSYEELDAVLEVLYDDAGGGMAATLYDVNGETLENYAFAYVPGSGIAVGEDVSLQFERNEYDEEDLDYVSVRLHDYFGTGALYAVFEGSGMAEPHEKEPPPPRSRDPTAPRRSPWKGPTSSTGSAPRIPASPSPTQCGTRRSASPGTAPSPDRAAGAEAIPPRWIPSSPETD